MMHKYSCIEPVASQGPWPARLGVSVWAYDDERVDVEYERLELTSVGFGKNVPAAEWRAVVISDLGGIIADLDDKLTKLHAHRDRLQAERERLAAEQVQP